jgi:FAD:protein FMN transferase
MVKYISSKLVRFTLFFTLVVLLSGCSSLNPGWSEQSEIVLGTLSQIRIHSNDMLSGDDAVQEAFNRVLEIDERMSYMQPDSQISQINSSAGTLPVTVTDDTLYLIEEGLRQHESTGGRFHIGLGSLIDLWGIGSEEPSIPEPEEIRETLNAIDIEHINVSGSQVLIRESGTSVHLGGMAKGYAVDEAVRILRDMGVTSGYVNFGGDVYALGSKPDGDQWSVGIKEPVVGSFDLVGRIIISDRSVVTSGDYERFISDESGRHYHHILDPATGYPTDNELVSVTIVSDTSLKGDILSTASLVMGLDAGYAHILETPDTEGLLITRSGDIYLTPGLAGIFELMNDAYRLAEI